MAVRLVVILYFCRTVGEMLVMPRDHERLRVEAAVTAVDVDSKERRK